MLSEKEALALAKARLDRVKNKIYERSKQTVAEEPKSLVSGIFDEVELARRHKEDDESEED